MMLLFPLIGAWIGWKLFTGLFDFFCGLLPPRHEPEEDTFDEETSTRLEEQYQAVHKEIEEVHARMDNIKVALLRATTSHLLPAPTTKKHLPPH